MGGQKFQYDESGGTFFYFLLSFLVLILIPATFYYWPRKPKKDPKEEDKECHCPGCLKKKELLKAAEPWRGPKNFLIKLTIISGWVLLALLTYKVSQFDYEMANFDPYEILRIPLGASQSEIKKAYRKLSVILHPDKETGDEKEFMKLTKAYQALTDEEARKNWEKYGNPDGPGAMSFGIALPSWIVEKENSVWVLGLYALVFMVALPIVVGTWWYRSIRFTGDQVLLDTTQMYYYFFHKTPNMMLKRVIMILSASLEFDRKHNSEIIERQSDNEEVPQLIKKLPNLSEKNKERPLCFGYSIKARAIIHAHLSRMPLNPTTLEIDRQCIIAKCPYLIQEQVNSVNQLIMLAYARRIQRLPTIETIENCMKLCPMIVQALWEHKSPFLQLPYISDDNLKHFMSKKRQIKSLQQFAQLKGEERRNVLRNLSDEEYENIMKVLGRMPYVDFQVKCEVMDDENPTEVTAGAIVTVTVSFIRKDMSTLFGDDTVQEAQAIKENGIATEAKETGDNEPDHIVKRPAWLKQKKGGGKKGKKTKPTKMANSIKVKPSSSPVVAKTKPKEEKKESVKEKEESDSESDGESHDDDRSTDEDLKSSSVDDDDQEWERFQQKLHRREKALEGRSKVSHSVHCPYFPQEKQEYWWTYICDRKSHSLLTAPYHVTNLVDREDCQLKFTAPIWPGVYTFTVCLRSDSYIGFDQQKDIKLDVKQAPAEITDHPQWEFEDSENEKSAQDDGNESEYTTDELPDDEDD
ncbi:translocation protein SEC63 homolog [Agrilus planipennis]|uniref:Translocation protein SEC63 homolog n=1 Tax=Agrilus planipennis TaxID=224129 RepID=A0A1W4X2W8_AGRPL|nr:translocation protein SEC63 homolog [Agrilus planipennis]